MRSDQRALGFYDFQSKSVAHLFDLSHKAHFGLSISPDGDSVLFTQGSLPEADIMLVEGFE
ncbi:MAG: hypothetical protein GY953_53200 [bacterium]|nr:hypothetical protein [bacterium]